jgi:hypothetical protein
LPVATDLNRLCKLAASTNAPGFVKIAVVAIVERFHQHIRLFSQKCLGLFQIVKGLFMLSLHLHGERQPDQRWDFE